MTIQAARFREILCDRFLIAQEATRLPKSQFAKDVGLTPQGLSNIAVYRNPPSHEAIHRAMLAFGFTADWFYVGSTAGFRDPDLASRLRDITERAEIDE